MHNQINQIFDHFKTASIDQKRDRLKDHLFAIEHDKYSERCRKIEREVDCMADDEISCRHQDIFNI